MGHKIFVSYKYADDQVANLTGQSNSTVRDYVDELESYFDSSSHIYKGESSGEDLSQLEEETIWTKLRDRIFDSTMTIVFISPGMKVSWTKEKDQWIPWEVSFSLRTTKRKNQNGDTYSSNPNAMLAVVLPDANGSYNYFLEKKTCCTSGCTTHHTNNTFAIIRQNMFNLKSGIRTFAIQALPFGTAISLTSVASNGATLSKTQKPILRHPINGKRTSTTTTSTSI